MTFDEIMELVKHMKTDTPEQLQEREKEAMRIIQENHDKEMLKIQEKHEKTMRIIEGTRKNEIEHNNLCMNIGIRIQEIRARTPKSKIYFGKVKTE